MQKIFVLFFLAAEKHILSQEWPSCVIIKYFGDVISNISSNCFWILNGKKLDSFNDSIADLNRIFFFNWSPLIFVCLIKLKAEYSIFLKILYSALNLVNLGKISLSKLDVPIFIEISCGFKLVLLINITNTFKLSLLSFEGRLWK